MDECRLPVGRRANLCLSKVFLDCCLLSLTPKVLTWCNNEPGSKEGVGALVEGRAGGVGGAHFHSLFVVSLVLL